MTHAETEALIVKSTNTVAVLGMILPMWWPTLAQISSHAALWTPILGAAWLITQIIRAWFFNRK